jgi:hypothetical protein
MKPSNQDGLFQYSGRSSAVVPLAIGTGGADGLSTPSPLTPTNAKPPPPSPAAGQNLPEGSFGRTNELGTVGLWERISGVYRILDREAIELC